MKKHIILPIILGVSLSIASVNLALLPNKSTASIHYPEAEYVEGFGTVESLVDTADTIVKATLLSKKQADEAGLFEYFFKVDNALLGDMQEIKILERGYESSEEHGHEHGEKEFLFEEGKQYYMFLESWENEYYPTTIYTNVHKEGIVKIEGEKIKAKEEIFGKVDSEKELSKTLDSLIKNKNKTFKKVAKKKVINKAETVQELESLSEIVALIKPTEVIDQNKNVKIAKADTVEILKGELGTEINVLLPSTAKVGEEYMIFGNLVEDTLRISTRKSSFISVKSAEFSGIYNQFK